MLRARVIDPAGPAWWRMATLLAGFSVLPVGLPFGLAASAAAVMLGLAWMFVVRDAVPPLSPRDALLVVEPGLVRISKAGVASQRIAARSVLAASTAATERGASIALVRGSHKDRPILIELASDADAVALRRALGIGVSGFGVVAWPPAGNSVDWSAPTRWLAASGWAAMAVSTVFGHVELALGLFLLVALVSVGALVLTEAAERRPGSRRATPAEVAHAAASAKSADERARRQQATSAPTLLAPLARTAGEGARAWLERVDAMAASLVEDEGYRRIGLDPADLRDTLEDPDAPPSLRAVAARVLARVAPDEARQRIGDALALERDADTRAHIRVALEEDVEIAARGLDRFERS